MEQSIFLFDGCREVTFFSYLCIEITGGGGIAEAFVKVFCETDVSALSIH